MSYGTNAPNGLRPLKTLGGKPYEGALNEYPITSTYASSMFTGDPVTLASDGTLVRGTAGSACVGVFMGCKYIGSDGIPRFMPYWPGNPGVLAGNQPVALVLDDPDMIFTAQETNGAGAAGTPLALTDVGLNINFLYTAGNTATGQSAVSIDNSTEATTSSLNLKLVGLDPTPGNVVGSFANWLVAWNNHLYKSGVTGV